MNFNYNPKWEKSRFAAAGRSPGAVLWVNILYRHHMFVCCIASVCVLSRRVIWVCFRFVSNMSTWMPENMTRLVARPINMLRGKNKYNTQPSMLFFYASIIAAFNGSRPYLHCIWTVVSCVLYIYNTPHAHYELMTSQ